MPIVMNSFKIAFVSTTLNQYFVHAFNFNFLSNLSSQFSSRIIVSQVKNILFLRHFRLQILDFYCIFAKIIL